MWDSLLDLCLVNMCVVEPVVSNADTADEVSAE